MKKSFLQILSTFVSLFILCSCSKDNDVNPKTVCLLKSAYTTDKSNNKLANYSYTYNTEGIQTGYTYASTSQSTPDEYKYIVYKENLGSETKPYVILTKNGVTYSEYFCDKDTLLKREISGFSVYYYEYNSKGELTKRNGTSYNPNSSSNFITGYSIDEYEYQNGNLIKVYTTNLERNGNVENPRYMSMSVSYGKYVDKLVMKLYYKSFKFYNNIPTNSTRYNTNGSVSSSENYNYTLDATGNLLTFKSTSMSGDENTQYFTYDCK